VRGIVRPQRALRALFGTIATAVAACSFPDFTFAPQDAGDAETMASGSSSGFPGSTGGGAAAGATQGASGRSTSGNATTASGAATGTASGSVSGNPGGSTGSTGAGSGVTTATDSAAPQDTSSAADQAAPPGASGCEAACMAPKDATTPVDSMSPVDATETHYAAAADDKATVDDPVVEATMDAPTCDFDHDGYLAGADVSTCGGNDCDDTDAHANPGVGSFQYWFPLGKMNGDWNCNGKVEKQYPANINCSSLLNVQCDTIQGFTGDDPGCSMLGIFVQCTSALVGLNCMDGPAQHVRQGCM